MAEKVPSKIEKVSTIKTVKKWEEEFKCRLSYDLKGGKVCRLRCTECIKWERRINKAINFSMNWISPGSTSIAKDSVAKHCKSDQHKKAVKYSTQSELGADTYKESVVMNSPS